MVMILAAMICATVGAGEPGTQVDTDKTETAKDGGIVRLATDVLVFTGAVNTGALVCGDTAILIDCCDSVTPDRLATAGIRKVDRVLFTQFRRPNTAGAYALAGSGAALYAPNKERDLFEHPDEYWRDEKNRWHIYHSRPGLEVPARPLPLAGTVKGGDTVEWNGFSIQAIDTPGATDGAVSYLVTVDGKTFCFCGDVMSGSGQVWDLHSLQKGFGVVGDYHGILGARGMLLESLARLRETNPDWMIPSHGAPFENVQPGIDLLVERLNSLWHNYAAITALNFYFPSLFEDLRDDPLRMKPAETFDPPEWVRRVAGTSFAVVSDTGALLLVDCGSDSVLKKLDEWKDKDPKTVVEACWVTHYHDDHVDALQCLVDAKCPIMADASMAEILEHPNRFYLPCIAPTSVPVAKVTSDGESWSWHEFTLTACHFPGQTLYHGGLLIEGKGKKVLFAGDSLAPTGVDDYCAGNRLFLGKRQGCRRCFEIICNTKPDCILNQHQEKAFSFTSEQLDYMDKLLGERKALIEQMTPWNDANFAVDEHWVRVYPYEQQAAAGSRFELDVQFTNHGGNQVQAEVEAVLPQEWKKSGPAPRVVATVPPNTCGFVDSSGPNSDGCAKLRIDCPAGTGPGLYVVPVRIVWGGRYLGAVRHGLVRVR